MVRSIAAFALGVLLVASGLATTHGAEAITASLTPLVNELSAAPGEQARGTIEVTNVGTVTQTFYPIAYDFEADPRSGGAPKFLPVPTDTVTPAVSTWLRFLTKEITIEPKATHQLAYTIDVPEGAPAGGYYGAVFASTKSAEKLSTSGLSLGGSVGSLVLLTVSGDVTVAGAGKALVSVNEQGKLRRLFQSWPIHFALTLENSGSVHLTPTGTLTISLRGRTVVSQPLNSDGGRVLPRSSRQFGETVNDSHGYGRFTAIAAITMIAPTGESVPATLTTTFWVLPIVPILLGLLGVTILCLLFRWWLRKHDEKLKRAVRQ